MFNLEWKARWCIYQAFPLVLVATVLAAPLYAKDYCVNPVNFGGGGGYEGHTNPPESGPAAAGVDRLFVSLSLDVVPLPIDEVHLRVIGVSPETGNYVSVLAGDVVVDGGAVPDAVNLWFDDRYDINTAVTFSFAGNPLGAGSRTATLVAEYTPGLLASVGTSWSVGIGRDDGFLVFFGGPLTECSTVSVTAMTWDEIKELFR